MNETLNNTSSSPEPTPPLITKILRFLLVGVGNTLIDFAVFALLNHLGALPLVANVGAWIVAVTFSYFVNSRWSFQRNEQVAEGKSAARFVVSGAIISLGVSSLAVTQLAQFIGLWPAKITGTVIATVLNFFASRWSIEGRIS